MDVIQDERVRQTLERLKSLAQKSIQVGNEEKALAAISAATNLLYQYNQIYTDQDLEDMLLERA